MYEYTIRYLENGEEDYLYGYSERDVCNREPRVYRLNPTTKVGFICAPK